MSQTDRSRVTLPCDARSVRRARELVREALAAGDAHQYLDGAELAVSEIVTNAVVHAGTPVDLYVGAVAGGVRIEVVDGSAYEPTRRTFAPTAATGRGMQLLEACVDRWGIIPGESGKIIWFELGEPTLPEQRPDHPAAGDGHAADVVNVELIEMPLLMHWAWQEHAAALLREYLLFALDHDPDVLHRHAEAGTALNILAQQVPLPELPDDPEALLADAVEPSVSRPKVELRIPREAVWQFGILDAMLCDAIATSGEGRLLAAPTQPEIGAMREWVCAEVLRQADGAPPRPWDPHTDPRATAADLAQLHATYGGRWGTGESVLAADEASVIVAVTPPVVELLGYADEDDLVGRRLLAVIPTRFHQAHIAGTTLHHANGRSTLLDVPVTVPLLRADGTEVTTRMTVSASCLDTGERVFLARFG